ncbi:helix-turn-helix domain-containing protein [Streptomyces sp. SID8111]|uniref:helix-turn-helix domain-containing protein n=1 Tax=Streptomyces sp. SID8111 TaxID=2706100 RepID=UPI0013BF39F0|nr:helix-turn-helix domain-containing protein [Streptomyces sp. SID8111]
MAGRPGRREQPLDPQAGPLERFALGLRALRERAGLTYSEMAEASHFSPSTLSQAAAGRRLPTRDVLRAYVRACGGDPRGWEDRWERVRREVPGPAEPDSAVGDVPQGLGDTEATSFVGREAEMAAGSMLLDRFRLVTLVGTGGVGKTRLAKRIAHSVAGRFADGVHCVELADLDDDQAVTGTIASAMGVQVGSGQEASRALAVALQGREILLLLDNCEHLLAGSARAVRALLTRLPGLRILATSRQPLDVGAEHVLPVEPLGLPPVAHARPDASSSALSVTEDTPPSPAMTLFADRAEAASPGFRITEANRHVVASVCRRLDGLPLALEIAARRLRTLTPDELLERLDHRFRLLGPGASDPTVHPRHRALRALFDWSYELCTDAERRAWQQLSLCSGGVLLTDAEQLCGRTATGEDSPPAEDDTFEALAGLVDKSLASRVDAGAQTRLHMLETVRAYGQERLAEDGRTRQALLRHRAWYLGLAAQAGAAYGSSREAGWLRRLRAEHVNLRQIVTADPPAGEPPEAVLRAAPGFWLHCLTSGNVGEGAGWMRTLLERHPRPPSSESSESSEAVAAWCRAVWVAGFLMLLHGDHTGAQEMITRGEQSLGGIPAAPGPSEPEPETPERDELTAALLQLRSLVALVAGDPETSVKYADACLAGGRWCSSLLTQPQCVAQLGFAAVLQGRRPQSADLLGQALRMSEERGDTWHRCYLLWALAVDHGEAGEPETALRFLRRALRHIREIDECMGEAALGETLAWVLSSQGDARLAAMVLGAVDGAWHPSGAPRLFGFASLTAHRERCIRNAHEALGRAEYARAYREGLGVGLRQAVKTAFEQQQPQQPLPGNTRNTQGTQDAQDTQDSQDIRYARDTRPMEDAS